MPAPLVLIEIAAGIIGIAWVVSFSFEWHYRVIAGSAFLLLMVLHSWLVKSYERTGRAVRIPKAEGVSYVGRPPALVRRLRIAFGFVVALMLLFGFAPMPLRTAHDGIIACVLSLFVVGFLHFFAERRYVASGRAMEKYDLTQDITHR
jgi:hypothetical protein